MARTRVQYVCQQCGRAAAKPLGRCPQCGAWNSMVSETVSAGRGKAPPRPGGAPVRLSELPAGEEPRYPLSIEEFSRVLGGGVVPGSLVLVGGDPGIGKSTLMLQMALTMAETGPVLYVSGEESARQIQGRAKRLPGGSRAADDLYLLTETDLAAILSQIDALHPKVVIVDSIQTVQVPELDSGAGSLSQVREAALRLQAQAKSSDAAIFVVGHVTKDGAIAGPKVLEHIVDTVLYLEGDPLHAFRLLRAVKNRFGPTTEVGVFAMGEAGMVEVPNPSEAFLAERVLKAPGSAVAVTLEGTRPLLVEVQGLTSPTAFGNPRRTANGVDFNRLLLTLAVLTRRVGLHLGDQDVFVNVVGGLHIEEPAADLAVAVAVASSLQDKPIPADLAFVGEIGLTGELRSVSQMPLRLREAAKLGFRRVVIPRSLRETTPPDGIEVLSVRSVREALDRALGAAASAKAQSA